MSYMEKFTLLDRHLLSSYFLAINVKPTIHESSDTEYCFNCFLNETITKVYTKLLVSSICLHKIMAQTEPPKQRMWLVEYLWLIMFM